MRLAIGAGIVVVAGWAHAQTRTIDPRLAAENVNSGAVARRNTPAVATPNDATAPRAHKAWKDVARAHNEEKSRDTHAATLSPWTALSALAVVVGLILILARIFRRHAPLLGQTIPSEAVEVLGRRFLDQRQSVVLVRIGSRILVVGSSTAGLQGLGELSDPVEVDLIAGLCRGSKNGRGNKNVQSLGTSFLSMLAGQAGSPSNVRRAPQVPRRADAVPADSALHLESDEGRLSDPEQELVRRLRGVPAVVPQSGSYGGVP